MKKLFKTPFLLSLILCNLTFHGIAQKPTFSWGIEQKCIGNMPKVFHSDEQSYYISENRAEYSTISRFDINTNKLITKIEVNFKFSGKKLYNLSNCLYTNNKIYYFAQDYNSKKHTNTIYKKSYNLDLTEESDWEFFEEKGDAYNKYLNSWYLNEIWNVKSEDKSKIAIITQCERKNKSDFYLIQFDVYDNKLNKLYSNQIDYKSEDYAAIAKKANISNDGTFVLLAKKREGSWSEFSYALFVCDKNNKTTEQYEVNLENKYVSTASYYLDNKTNKLILGGFYLTNDSKKHFTHGIFFQSFDLSERKIDNENTQDFSDELFPEFKEGIKTNDIAYFFNIRNLEKKDNGTYEILAEQDYTIDDEFLIVRDGYSYYHILYANIESNLKILKNITIPKIQAAVRTENNGQFLSFAFYEKNNITHLLYYDHKKNMAKYKNKNEDLKPLDLTNSSNINSNVVLVHTTIDEKGEVTKEILTEGSKLAKEGNYYSPRYYNSFNNKLIVIGQESSKDYKFGTITFK
ncbi:MAG: hypothetical protein NTU43_02875 [Bacteroidetes bacterium]|nr:hypothetical protein [Bacteroidota bacterium]